MMVRKVIAVAAVSGSLALGAAGIVGTGGVAGAATPSTPSSATPATRCVKAEKVATRVEALEAKAQAWLPKAQSREAKATAAGHTTLARVIAGRIARVQKREARGTTLLAKIAAKCGTSGSTSTG